MMSPGKRPKGRFVLPRTMNKTPASSRTAPRTINSLPTSVTLSPAFQLDGFHSYIVLLYARVFPGFLKKSDERVAADYDLSFSYRKARSRSNSPPSRKNGARRVVAPAFVCFRPFLCVAKYLTR